MRNPASWGWTSSVNHWTVVAEIEDVISGAKATRAGLDELMRLVRRHSIKAVLLYKLDRLGRSLPHLVQTIA